MGKYYDLAKMEKTLKKYLDSDRFNHTIGVTYTAASLAMAHGEDMELAQTAGLLHDCAKCIPNKKKLKLCQKYQVPITAFEEENPFLIHAKLGAAIAKVKYGVEDDAILNAITWHTTGKPDMTRLEKIIYIADYIEPHRDKAPNLSSIRQLAFADLDACMYEILKDTLIYLEANPERIDETSKQAYLYYKQLIDDRKGNLHE